MRAIRIPADETLPITVIHVEPGFESLATAIGGPCRYIERFKCPLTKFGLVGVLDEDGQGNGQPPNRRAHPLYPVPGYALAGDVLVMAERYDPMEGADFVDISHPEVALELVNGLLEGAVR